jgi:predicted Fe-Mo cluster-binding NifX family protein
MKVCIPTVDDHGLEGRLSKHFGSAPHFVVYDSDGGGLRVVPNRDADHVHGRCEAVSALRGMSPDAVVCLGMGRRAFASLQEAGIAVFVTEAQDVAGALEAFWGGRLVPLNSEEACHGGQHEGRSRDLATEGRRS